MKRVLNIILVVLCGIVGGWLGYWLGYLLGWSANAKWPTQIGSGTGAILMSIAGALVFVALAWLLFGRRVRR